MDFTLLGCFIAALAGLVAWRQAAQLDQRSLAKRSAMENWDERRAWHLTLGSLIAAAAATALLQVTLLERLRLLRWW